MINVTTFLLFFVCLFLDLLFGMIFVVVFVVVVLIMICLLRYFSHKYLGVGGGGDMSPK